MSPGTAGALYLRAQIAGRFHRFEEAKALLDQALSAGYSRHEIDLERASLLQATGQYEDSLVLRERLAKQDAGIHTLGALASLLAEMDRWSAAETCYAAALDADDGVSPFPCSQLLFEWGVSAMRRGDLDRAEAIFAELDAILPRTFRDADIAPRWRWRADSWTSRRRSSCRCSRPLTIRNIARFMRRSSPRAVTAKLRAKRNVPLQRTSCCWRVGPKLMPTTRQPSSWASATDRSVRSSWRLANLETPRHATLAQAFGQGAAQRAASFGGAEGCRMSGNSQGAFPLNSAIQPRSIKIVQTCIETGRRLSPIFADRLS